VNADLVSMRSLGGRPGPGVLDEPEPGAPAYEEQGEHEAGDDDEGELYTGAGEQPKSHPTHDCAQPNRNPGGQRVGVPPGPPNDRPNQTPGQKRPSGVRHAKQVGRLFVAAASNDRKDRDADHVHRDRWKDLHEPHTTLRPWLPQPIVMSPPQRARSWLPA
jgi:hypothetical protein